MKEQAVLVLGRFLFAGFVEGGAFGDAVGVSFAAGVGDDQFGEHSEGDSLGTEEHGGDGVQKQRATADGGWTEDRNDIHEDPHQSQVGEAEGSETEEEEADSSEHVLWSLSEAGEELDRQQVEEASQESLDSVLGVPELSRAMVDGNFGDLESTGVSENRDEAMHLSVESDFLSHFPSEHFDSAVVVMQVKPGQLADHPVEDFTWIHLVPGVEASLFPAVDNVVSVVDLREEVRDLCWIILQVGIHHHDDVATDRVHAGGEGCCFSEVSTEANAEDARVFICQLRNNGPGFVSRSVVNENDFDVDGVGLARFQNLPVQFDQALFFVEHGNDDRQHEFLLSLDG